MPDGLHHSMFRTHLGEGANDWGGHRLGYSSDSGKAKPLTVVSIALSAKAMTQPNSKLSKEIGSLV